MMIFLLSLKDIFQSHGQRETAFFLLLLHIFFSFHIADVDILKLSDCFRKVILVIQCTRQ